MGWRLQLYITLSFLSFIAIPSIVCANGSQTYIIHMDMSSVRPTPFSTHQDWHKSILASISTMSSAGNENSPPIHLYTYNHVLSGFSAVLSPSQLQNLKNHMAGHEVIVQPDSFGQLHTTHSPSFLRLNHHVGLWPTSRYGDDVIIGMIDSGVWPESESFSDKGMPPVPERWKGGCENGTEFSSSLCNRKLIGARSFSKGLKQKGYNMTDNMEYDSPRDAKGHGTHTASTAAGSPVHGASYYGYAKGTARGIAPMARVAQYKVSFRNNITASDVLAAMDQAIEDGVDLISISLGFEKKTYYDDPVAIGALSAIEKGIVVSCSAGNAGPTGYTIHNGAPWITTVGAGTIDRDYVAIVSLGYDEKRIKGQSLYPENIYMSNISLYFGHGNISKESCNHLALDPELVAEKIVLCSPDSDVPVSTQLQEVRRTGAKGSIFITDLGKESYEFEFDMPLVKVSSIDGEAIKEYATKAKSPTVRITFILTELGSKPAPRVADFSSRGPNMITPMILKPDILAPGVDILAAWVPNRAFAPIGENYLSTDYALVSGTSMASPHMTGIAALIRSVHRDWSPAAIRSALMTTADITDNTGGPIMDMFNGEVATPLGIGAGHVNPNKAMDPGLVYDIGIDDYLDFICGLNYTSLQIRVLTRRSNYNCTRANLDLNYPSFMVILKTSSSSQVFDRILTNVGDQSTSYRALVQAPRGMKVIVQPQILSFEGKYSRREFWMRVDIELNNTSGANVTEGDYIGNYGFLSWIEIGGEHIVRSPIVSAFTL